MTCETHYCCKKDGAYRVKDPRFNLDWIVSSFGGLAQAQFNNSTKEYLTSYPIPVSLKVTSGNVGYGSKLMMTAVADRDGAKDNITGTHDILDEMSTFILSDSQGLFETGVIPVYGAGASEDDDQTRHSLMRINDEELCIDVKVETTSYLQATPGATNKVVHIVKVHDLTKRKHCTENQFKCLSFVTYEIHTAGDSGTPANEIYISFVKNCKGKYFMGLLHGAAAAAASVPAAGIYPKPKTSASYRPVAWEKFKIVSVPMNCGVGIDSVDLRGKLLDKTLFDLEVLQRTVSAPSTTDLVDGTGFILGIYSGNVTVATDPVNTSQVANEVSNANKIAAYNTAGVRLMAAFTGFITNLNTTLASLV